MSLGSSVQEPGGKGMKVSGTNTECVSVCVCGWGGGRNAELRQ